MVARIKKRLGSIDGAAVQELSTLQFGRTDELEKLLTLLADISAEYLIAQIDAGADAVQIFDSWAGVLGEEEFKR